MKISSLSDAIAAMDYLLKRELLCQKCGWQLSVWRNVNHARCEDCKPKLGEYQKVSVANEFERRMCEALHNWLAADTEPSAPTQPGDPAISKTGTSYARAQELHPGDVGEVVPKPGS